MNGGNKPLRVLVADDHAPTRDDVRRALDADARFSICSEVADAAEAVQAAVSKQPDICLLDIRMPGSGLAAAWEIAARLPRAKIVMLTVSDDDTDLFTALRAGAHGYLLKGASGDQIRCAIHAAASGEIIFGAQLAARMLACFTAATAPSPPFPQLTGRERQVLDLLAQGRANTAIATRLSLSHKTVRNHVSNILAKLQVTDRAQAIIQARDAGMGQAMHC